MTDKTDKRAAKDAGEPTLVEVLFGPYAGSTVRMSSADAAAAVAAKWALDPPRSPPIDASADPLPTLSPEERQAAELAANTWAAEQRGEPVPVAPDEPEGKRKHEADVRPSSSSRRGYETR